MEPENRAHREDPSFRTLISNLTKDVTSLVRQEVELAKAETSQKASRTMAAIASIALAGAILLSGFLVLLVAAVDGLGNFLPADTTPWLSALIVGAIVIIIGLIMLQSGRKKLQQQNLTPQRTVESLRSDREFAKQHTARAKEQVK